MAVAYAPKGLFGLLTPQANTTVEPECRILTPRGFDYLTARLTSAQPQMTDRLIDYIERVEDTLSRFANAPLQAASFACTGASYLIGPVREAQLCAGVQARRGFPLITAGNAIADALDALGARRLGLVSPYGEPLTGLATEYWQARGFEIAKLVDIASDAGAFHPIYALSADRAGQGLAQIRGARVDAVVLLGTGLPTLPALAAHDLEMPVMSSNLCLLWRTIQAITGETVDAASLHPWLRGSAWSLPQREEGV